MSTFKTPTAAQVEAALRQIPTFQLRRVFFEELANPLWIKPLQAADAFANPPQPKVDEKGLVREPYWPEIDYLTRMAPLAPGAVVDVLLTLTKSENSWVRRGAFAVGAVIPVDQAARLKPLVTAWKGNFGFRTDSHDLAVMTSNLLSSGHRTFGRSLANTLFRPESATSKKGHPSSVLEEYWYEQELPLVVEALGPDALATVMSWLEQWERADGRYTETSDMTSFGRVNIAHRDSNYGSVEQTLVDTLRDVAVASFATDPLGTAKHFLSRPLIILRKIALYSAGKAVVGTPTGRDLAGLLNAGQALLEDSLSGNHACRIEFADLYQALLERGAAVESALRVVLAAGPYGSQERLLKVVARRADKNRSSNELESELTEDWQQRLLATIGADHLPQDLVEVLADLDRRNGPITAPREPDFKTTSWSGPTSPLSRDELDHMSATDLADYLEQWRSGDAWMAPSHEGMARELTELIKSKPAALAGIGDLSARLRPTYLRAILGGWIAALKDGVTVDWTQVLETVGQVLSHSDESEIASEGREFDDDPDFANAKQAATTLLTDLATPDSDPPRSTEVMENVARLLIGSSSDESAWTRYNAREATDSMDPLTTSLNWQWPIMVRGLIALAGHGPSTTWFSSAVTALERELARADKIGASYAVLGEGLARLFNNAPEWLNEHLDSLFGTEAGLSRAQQIALTTALATHRTHPKILELLRGAVMGAIQLNDRLSIGWNGQFDGPELLGHWIVTCLIWGELSPEDPLVVTFFETASAETRGSVIGHIAWSFMHAESVDEDIRLRFEKLWDARVNHVRETPGDSEELKDFYWFVRSEKFAPEWWLPRLKEAAELNQALTTHGMIGEQLSAASAAMPRGALEALQLLMDRDDESGANSYDLSEHAAPAVIAAALDSGDTELEKDALRFMNVLGARGFITLEERVNALRVG